ncbi:MAG: hypothetical protein HQK55_07410 [Deltaproteobacteria bacterium]|nr:hypothetical protein [Deltaproteobacteria bacterium]
MVLKLLARDLYLLERQVEDITKRLGLTATPSERSALEDQLRRTTAERDELRGRLESQKTPPTYRTTFR